jgi:predicted porin
MTGRGQMTTLRSILTAAGAALALGAAARAADLPTTKEAAPPAPANCFSSIWAYIDSTAVDCPLSYGPFTVYATLDGGIGYESNGAGFNRAYNNGVANFISKQSYGPKWLWTPNGINQTVIGIKVSQPIAYGWSLVGTLEAGFDPFSGYLTNGPRSLVENNGKALVLQNANSDSSRAGQWDNSQGFIGLINKTYGALTVGRVNSLTLDGIIAGDPMGGAYAFSPLGYSGQYAGFGNTETNRANTGLKYRVDFMNFRGAGLVQWGGYDQGNGTTGMYQGQVGADFANLYGGTLSLDAIGSYAQNAVSLSTFSGTCAVIKSGPFKGQTGCSSGIPNFYDTEDLKATLSNNTGFTLLGKYKWGPATLYGGYEWWRQADPSSTFPNGFETLGGFSVPGTIPSTLPGAAKNFPTQWINYTAYINNRFVNVFFVGAKYAITPQLDATAAFYYLDQNNYNSSTAPCAYANTTFVQPNGNSLVVSRVNNGACAGSQDAISFLLDYRPVKRVDLYAGLMISNVYAGLANGYQATQNIAPTAGLRVKF